MAPSLALYVDTATYPSPQPMQCAALSLAEEPGESGARLPGDPPPLSYPLSCGGCGSVVDTSEMGLAALVTSHSCRWQSLRSAASNSRGDSPRWRLGDGTCESARIACAPPRVLASETTFHSLASVAGLSSAIGVKSSESASRSAMRPVIPPNARSRGPTGHTEEMPSSWVNAGESWTV